MLAFVIVLQVLVALFLIMVVLLQPGNRGGASAALGGAGSDTVFGGRGANTFLSKITFGAAVCFMVTNFALSYMSSTDGDKSVLDVLEKSQPKASGGAAATDPNAPASDAGADSQAKPGDGAESDVESPAANVGGSDSIAPPEDKPQGDNKTEGEQ
jgi:preprotein translocase subunit SecG